MIYTESQETFAHRRCTTKSACLVLIRRAVKMSCPCGRPWTGPPIAAPQSGERHGGGECACTGFLSPSVPVL